MTEHLKMTWRAIMQDKNHHIIVKKLDGKIVSSCVCVIIPNLTRNIRPYAFIENVVTHSDYRGKGYATECLNYAKQIAENTNCYKMMLLTGSKKKEILNFMGMRDITVQIKQRLFNGLNNTSSNLWRKNYYDQSITESRYR